MARWSTTRGHQRGCLDARAPGHRARRAPAPLGRRRGANGRAAQRGRVLRPTADHTRGVDCPREHAMTDQTGAIRTREAETPTSWRCLTCRLVIVDTILP